MSKDELRELIRFAKIGEERASRSLGIMSGIGTAIKKAERQLMSKRQYRRNRQNIKRRNY